MCIVIDTNSFSAVFAEDNALHKEFSCVKAWIESGRGYLIYGGTNYKREIGKTGRHARLIKLLRDAGRAIAIQDEAVDSLEKKIIGATKGTDCDDQHLIALLGASSCPLVCTQDARAIPHLKNKVLYPKRSPAIKIFKSSRNKSLLTNSNPKKITNKAA